MLAHWRSFNIFYGVKAAVMYGLETPVLRSYFQACLQPAPNSTPHPGRGVGGGGWGVGGAPAVHPNPTIAWENPFIPALKFGLLCQISRQVMIRNEAIAWKKAENEWKEGGQWMFFTNDYSDFDGDMILPLHYDIQCKSDDPADHHFCL